MDAVVIGWVTSSNEGKLSGIPDVGGRQFRASNHGKHPSSGG